MDIEITTLGLGIIFGIIGGAIYPLMQDIGWQDKLPWVKHIIYGAIAGFFVGLFNVALVVQHFNPDLPWSSILLIIAPTATAAGYAGIDVLRALLKKYKPDLVK